MFRIIYTNSEPLTLCNYVPFYCSHYVYCIVINILLEYKKSRHCAVLFIVASGSAHVTDGHERASALEKFSKTSHRLISDPEMVTRIEHHY